MGRDSATVIQNYSTVTTTLFHTYIPYNRKKTNNENTVQLNPALMDPLLTAFKILILIPYNTLSFISDVGYNQIPPTIKDSHPRIAHGQWYPMPCLE